MFSPPLVSTTAEIYPGDSLPSQTSTAAATSTRTRDGKTTGPTTGNVQLTTAKTFVGMETVTTLAGTFRVCKFRHTDVADGRRTTYESWLLAGYGLNIDGWKSTTLPLQAVFSQTRLGPWRRALGLPAFLVLDRASIVRYRQVGIEQSAVDQLVELRRQVARVRGT